MFADIPVENLVFRHQAEYYEALQKSTNKTDSAPFIAFMLQMIMDVILPPPEATTEVTTEVAPEVKLVFAVTGEMTRQQLKTALGLKNDEHFRKMYLIPAMEAGLLEMTIPDKPRSNKQKYRLTAKGSKVRT